MDSIDWLRQHGSNQVHDGEGEWANMVSWVLFQTSLQVVSIVVINVRVVYWQRPTGMNSWNAVMGSCDACDAFSSSL